MMELDDNIYVEIKFSNKLWHSVNAITGEKICVGSAINWVLIQTIDSLFRIPAYIRIYDTTDNLRQEITIKSY
jgi:hypothetical protein